MAHRSCPGLRTTAFDLWKYARSGRRATLETGSPLSEEHSQSTLKFAVFPFSFGGKPKIRPKILRLGPFPPFLALDSDTLQRTLWVTMDDMFPLATGWHPLFIRFYTGVQLEIGRPPISPLAELPRAP